MRVGIHRSSLAAVRRVFVGDIQGCLEPLDRLLAEVGFAVGEDRLFPAGDLVNKGPDSVGVLRRLIELDARPVLGNHDLLWLRERRLEDPMLHGWLAQQPILRFVDDDLLLVHAGLHPAWDDDDLRELARPIDGFPTSPAVDFAVTVRYCDRHGRRPADDWPPPEAPFVPWDQHYHGPRRVVFGHWARRGLDVTPHAIALDSGCVYGKQLSAWIAEEDRIVQVPARLGS